MNGLELANLIRIKSPQTQIVMMTSFGTDLVQQTAANLRVAAFLNKPVDIKTVREIVLQTIADSQKDEAVVWQEKLSPNSAIKGYLSTLRRNTNAQCVLLLNTSGELVESAGSTANLDIMNTSVLIAANFVAAVEMFRATASDTGSICCHLEGPSDDIFCQDINGEHFLAVIYSAKGKNGIIRHYTQSTIELLKPLFNESNFQA
jgi:response regulator RpfG family c-di-GMP phosphodiesterase